MKKLPVGQTIAEAYRFTFAGLERVIAAIWLPVILLTMLDYFSRGPYLATAAAAMESGDTARLGPAAVTQLGVAIVGLVLQAVIAVAICREILTPPEHRSWLRFSLGSAEFRVLGGTFGVGVLMGIVMVIFVITGMILGGSLAGVVPANAMPRDAQALGMAVLLGLLFSPLLIYVFVRLGGLIVPAAVLDGGFGLERSWQLLKNNVWRLVLVSLAAVIPIMLVYLVLQVLILGPEAFSAQMGMGGDKPEQMRQMAEAMRLTADHLPLLKGLDFVIAPFLYGLACSAPVFAYKALTGPDNATAP